MTRPLAAALIALLAGAAADSAEAQSLHVRTDAPAGVKAKIARTIADVRVLQATRGGVDLNRTFLADDCGPVHIGADSDDKLSRHRRHARETPTVVTGSVVNICR